MGTQRIGSQGRSALNTEQKIAAVLLLVLAAGGVFFGFRSFGANLYRPSQLMFAKFYTGENVTDPNSAEAKRIADLKAKDTDGDGLSDYDETYVYKTNPYLKDSDGDGIDDKTEIMNGTDPNCPEGKTCNSATGSTTDPSAVSAEAVANTGTATTAGLLGTLPDPSAVMNSGKIQFQSKADVEAYLKSATAQQIRDTLLQTGQIKKEDLDKISDADLQKLYEQAVGQTSASGAMDSFVTPPATTTPTTPATASATIPTPSSP